jgi:hypothetical protein
LVNTPPCQNIEHAVQYKNGQQGNGCKEHVHILPFYSVKETAAIHNAKEQ